MYDDVSDAEKKQRFLALESLQRQIQTRVYRGYLGRELSVLVEGQSARSADDMTGHSTCHKVVNFRGTPALEGKIVDVLITEAKTNSLYGELVNQQLQ
jgi:tRNA-2-methylthio-N6-dimethylallyladenosine synthase